jgi:hypothetical protein
LGWGCVIFSLNDLLTDNSTFPKILTIGSLISKKVRVCEVCEIGMRGKNNREKGKTHWREK